MRLGVVLAPLAGERPARSLAAQAEVAEAAGLDLVWLEASTSPAPLAAAASLAGNTAHIGVAAAVPVGLHPLRLAEDAVVADNLLGGRLVLVLVDTDGDATLLAETAEVVLAAVAARPFAHTGRRWTIPGHRPGNEVVERRVRVTPAPAQIEMPVWLGGDHAAAVGREFGLSHVAAAGHDSRAAADAWSETEEHLGRVAGRLRRPALRQLDTTRAGDFDGDALVDALRTDRDRWGLDVVVLELPAELPLLARARAIDGIARLVRPRVQLDVLPDGLESHWQETAAAGGETERTT